MTAHKKTAIGAIILFLLVAPISAFPGVDGVNPEDGNLLTWDPEPGAIGYIVYYGQSVNSMTFKKDVGNKTWIKIESLEYLNPDFPWFLSVSAYAFDVESPKSTPILWGENGRKYVIQWARSSNYDVCGYRVYMANMSGVYEGGRPDCDTDGLSCDTPVLISGQTYRFKVVAYDCAGNVSSETEITKQITGTPSNKPADTVPPGPVEIISIQ